MRKSLTLVTDIPSPYRIHFFNALNEHLANLGVAFEVLFMARTVPIRFWHFDSTSCTFRYRIVPGIHLRYKNDLFHFNPGILWSVLKHQPTWLVIGGAWNMPTVLSLLFLNFLQKGRVCTILWSEANYRSMIFKRGLVPRIRAAAIRWADAIAVPGRVAEETVRNHWGVTDKPLILLPNLVNEHVFCDRVLSLRANRKPLRGQRHLTLDDLVLLWPARLHEETKGIINFLQAVKDLIPSRVKVFIAGEGSDRARIEAWLAASSLSGVFLLGQQSEQHMVELYAISDVLLLPSFRDPNPLSVIEGLWSGLPLFISRNCGNWPEALEGNANGWVVDPSSVESMRISFADMISKSAEELRECGKRSLTIAQDLFSTMPCVNSFVQKLMTLN